MFGVLTAKKRTSDFASNLMEIKITERIVNQGKPSVIISPNLRKERVIIDKDGNELSSINPRQAQILKRANDKE